MLAGPRRLRASTALERPLATRPDSLLRGGAAGERRVAAIAHAQPSTSHSAPGKGFRFARGWRKQKRWINGRSGDQAEALGDRAAACLIARRCKHHGVAGCARSLWRSPTRGPSGRSLSRNAIAPPAATSVIACVALRSSAPAPADRSDVADAIARRDVAEPRKRSRGWQHPGRSRLDRTREPTHAASGYFQDSGHGTADLSFGGRCLPRRG